MAENIYVNVPSVGRVPFPADTAPEDIEKISKRLYDYSQNIRKVHADSLAELKQDRTSVVDVPGVGRVAFPGHMSSEDIEKAIPAITGPPTPGRTGVRVNAPSEANSEGASHNYVETRLAQVQAFVKQLVDAAKAHAEHVPKTVEHHEALRSEAEAARSEAPKLDEPLAELPPLTPEQTARFLELLQHPAVAETAAMVLGVAPEEWTEAVDQPAVKKQLMNVVPGRSDANVSIHERPDQTLEVVGSTVGTPETAGFAPGPKGGAVAKEYAHSPESVEPAMVEAPTELKP
jgi:hypothetical protein